MSSRHLVLAALDVAANARDKFGSFLSLGVAALFFWHAFINMGMVTGVLPVVGVTLPLMSYGGSSVTAVLIGVGNGLGHTAATILGHTVPEVKFARPAPGFYSSPLLIAAAVWVIVELRRTAEK